MVIENSILTVTVIIGVFGAISVSDITQEKKNLDQWVQVSLFEDQQAQNRSGLSEAAKPRGNAQQWVTHNDYPSRARYENRKGSVAILLSVGENGRVTNCAVTKSSDQFDFDRVACRSVIRRARFYPATDYNGRPSEGVYPMAILFNGPLSKELKRQREENILWHPPIAIPPYD